MNIGERIKKARQKLGINQVEFAKLINVSKQTLYKYENNIISNIPLDKIEAIANKANVSPSYLMGWTDSKNFKSETTNGYDDIDGNIYQDETLPKNAIPLGQVGTLPIIGNVSAGNGAFAYDDILGYETVDKQYANDNYFYLHVIGDSMSPKIENDDLVLVHKQSSVDSGNYAVVTVDDENGCVKIIKYGSDWIELHSINPYYPVRRFEGIDVLRIRVIGKVIEVKRKL